MIDIEVQKLKNQFNIIGNSPTLNNAIKIVSLVAPTDLSVLIIGENGTGKESFAKIIHFLSNRRHNKYISINCGAIPEGTIDAELFGNEKGAYTGALEKRKGYFEEANKGTIFLDEIGEMPLETQVKLLRVLENSEIIKVGSSKVEKVDVRVIAATNVDLIKAIAKNRFREDLYYRINTIPLIIPPLRERKEDIPLLVKNFANDYAITYKTPPIILTDEASSYLSNYLFPGNIRQLKNIIYQISAIELERTISLDTIRNYIPKQELLVQKKSQTNDNFEYKIGLEYMYKEVCTLKDDIKKIKQLLMNILRQSVDNDKMLSDNISFFNTEQQQTGNFAKLLEKHNKHE